MVRNIKWKIKTVIQIALRNEKKKKKTMRVSTNRTLWNSLF